MKSSREWPQSIEPREPGARSPGYLNLEPQECFCLPHGHELPWPACPSILVALKVGR